MRIAVGFKVTPDFEALRAADWARVAAADGPEGRAEATRYVRRVFGVFDEAALELALRLREARERRDLETSLAAFTVGGREADPFLATLQALGFEAARVDPGEAGADGGLDFAPAATAALVAACAQRLGGDVLLLGERGGPGGSGTVPFLAAEALGRPCVAGVTRSGAGRRPAARDLHGRRRARARRRRSPVRAGRRQRRGLHAPRADAQGPAGGTRPAGRRVHARRPRRGPGGHTRRRRTRTRGAPDDRPRTSRRRRPGETPADKARALYEQHLRARLEEL